MSEKKIYQFELLGGNTPFIRTMRRRTKGFVKSKTLYRSQLDYLIIVKNRQKEERSKLLNRMQELNKELMDIWNELQEVQE